ncbi:MAG: hypothetical protein WBA46_12530 [Thermomicrobiales bacterium]
MIRRRWSLLASLVVLLSLLAAVPVAARSIPAQSGPSAVAAPLASRLNAQTPQIAPVTVAIWTCDVVRASDVVTFSKTFYKPDGAYDCVDGLPDGTFLDIDGVDPDSVTETTATWNWMFYGSHQLNVAETDTSMAFDVTSDTTHLYALYERAVLGGGWAEVHIFDCATAPGQTTTLVGTGSAVPDGYSVCVAGNTGTRDYGLLVDGQAPTYVETASAMWQLRGGNHVMTAKGGATSSFEINNWTVSLDLYTKGEVTSTGPQPPVDELPNTGVGPSTDTGGTWSSEMAASVALLAASVVLGYVSWRTARTDRA